MNYLVYQSYGNPDILNECKYSILSLLKYNVDTKDLLIVIYTDDREAFAFLPDDLVSVVELSKEQISDFKGTNQFVHRLKIMILRDAAKRFDGRILYADSDIYFLKNILPLFEKIDDSSFVMCNNEGMISDKGNRIFKKFSHFLEQNRSYLDDRNVEVHADTDMWNAGIIGFKSSQYNLLNDVLQTTDTILDKFSSHVIEQFSFSYVLQTNGMIHPANEHVFHYWNLKEFRSVLKEFFDHHEPGSSLEEMIADVDSIRPDVLIRPKLHYESLSLIPKALRKMRGKENRWRFPEYHIGRSR